jgi:hypothetical protein
MAIARAQLVDVSLTRWYHCVTRCVRRAFLLGEGDHNRKQWLQNRLEELAEIFAVSVGGFSVIIDLNPVAAKVAKTPETSDYTSIKQRVQIEKLRGDRLLGRFFAASRTELREIGERLGVRRLVNLRGCPIR